MTIYRCIIIICFYLYSNPVHCQIKKDTSTQIYIKANKILSFQRPRFYPCITHIPNDIFQIAKSPFYKKNWIIVSSIATSTLLLSYRDQPIIDWVKETSNEINLDPTTKYKDALKVGETRIIKIPQNFNSACYQLGEGGTSMMVAGGLLIYGKIKNSWRDIQTSYDLIETFGTMGVTTQLLKRISGRESPFKSTQAGGKWSPLPSFSAYQNHTPTYDAFPSGHLATMVATVTVLHENYPEKKWIQPLGISLIGLTGWAMMNTEVHWLSDYPLAIAVGYLSGKITAIRHRQSPKTKSVDWK